MDVYRGADKVAELGSYDELRVGANRPAFIYEGAELVYPNPVKDGLVLWYDFSGRTNSDSERGVSEDLSGNGNHGTLQNFNYTAESGYDKNKLLFDGIDDFLQIPETGLNPESMAATEDGKIYSYQGDTVTSVREDGGIATEKQNLLMLTGNLNGFWMSYKDSSITYEKVDMTDEWGTPRAYKVHVFGGTETIKGVWNSYGDSLGRGSRMTENMTFDDEYTLSMLVKNIGEHPLKFDLNGLVGAPQIVINPGETGSVQRTGTRRESYDWFQINVRPYEVEHEQEFIVSEIMVNKNSTSVLSWSPSPYDFLDQNYAPISMENLLLYNRALTPEEIAHNYTIEKERFGIE